MPEDVALWRSREGAVRCEGGGVLGGGLEGVFGVDASRAGRWGEPTVLTSVYKHIGQTVN